MGSYALSIPEPFGGGLTILGRATLAVCIKIGGARIVYPVCITEIEQITDLP